MTKQDRSAVNDKNVAFLLRRKAKYTRKQRGHKIVTVKSLRETRCDRDSQVRVHSGWIVMSMAFSRPSEGKALVNRNTDNATDERTLAGYGWYCNLDKDAPSVRENKAQKDPL